MRFCQKISSIFQQVLISVLLLSICAKIFAVQFLLRSWNVGKVRSATIQPHVPSRIKFPFPPTREIQPCAVVMAPTAEVLDIGPGREISAAISACLISPASPPSACNRLILRHYVTLSRTARRTVNYSPREALCRAINRLLTRHLGSEWFIPLPPPLLPFLHLSLLLLL